MPEKGLRVIAHNDIRDCLPMNEAVDVMAEAFLRFTEGSALAPQRITMPLSGPTDRLLFMPAYLPSASSAGVKLVTIIGDNHQRGLPLIQGMVLVVDSTDGQPVGLMNAAELTALRTGAASALATRLLARQDAHVAFIFGAGAQGRTQLEGVAAVRSLSRAYVMDTSVEKATIYAREMGERLSLEIIPVASTDALSSADVVCTATTSLAPLFHDASLKRGAHINAVGAYRPDMCEVPAATVCRARLVVDSRTACLEEAGDLLQPIQSGLCNERSIYAEIGEIVAGKKQGRVGDEEITLFKSVGIAVQDVAAAARVVEAARVKGVGTLIDV